MWRKSNKETTKRRSRLFCFASTIIYCLLSLTSFDTFQKECERYQKKLETTNDKEKTQRKAAEIEAAVATELVLVVDAQRKIADTQLEVSVCRRF